MSQNQMYNVLRKRKKKMTVNDIIKEFTKKNIELSKGSIQTALRRLTISKFIKREGPNNNNEYLYWVKK